MEPCPKLHILSPPAADATFGGGFFRPPSHGGLKTAHRCATEDRGSPANRGSAGDTGTRSGHLDSERRADRGTATKDTPAPPRRAGRPHLRESAEIRRMNCGGMVSSKSRDANAVDTTELGRASPRRNCLDLIWEREATCIFRSGGGPESSCRAYATRCSSLSISSPDRLTHGE